MTRTSVSELIFTAKRSVKPVFLLAIKERIDIIQKPFTRCEHRS